MFEHNRRPDVRPSTGAQHERVMMVCRLPQIYDEFYHTVNNADHEKDLRWWSNTHGVNMPMAWPQFEVKEYKAVYI